jgi:hypothetical protein
LGYPTIVKAKSKKAPASKKPAGGRKAPAGPSSPSRELDPDLQSVLKHVAPPVKDEAVAAEPIDEWVSLACPFCGESIDVHVTNDEIGQTLTNDCDVCCRPVSMHITFEESEVHIEAYRS